MSDNRPDRQFDITFSIKWKLIVLMTILMVGIISILTGFEISSQKRMMEAELGKRIVLMKENLTERAKTYTGNLAQQIEKDIAAYNFSGVAESVRNSTDNNKDVRYAVLINFSGKVFFQSRKSASSQSDTFHQRNLEALKCADITITEYEDNAESVIEIVTPVKISTAPWGVLRTVYNLTHLRREIEHSEHQIRYEIHRMIRKSMFASLIFVGIGFVIVLIVSMRFSKPLIQLAQAARSLSKSNFSDASDIPHIRSIAKDELGILADAFELMSREIRDLLQETRNYSEHLEELVRERTADLAAANEQLHHAKELAEAANKSKSLFLANMSHELRTPLNAILGFSQLMLRDHHLVPDYRENLETIVRSGEHLLTMINQVLDLSKIEAGRMTLHEKAFDFHRMLDDLEDMFALRTQEKKLRLIFERSSDVPQYIKADELRLRQILINLLSNSVKFTKEGGIAMRVSSEPSIQKILLHFEIEDTGIGMDEHDLHTIFDAFVQSESGKMAGEGTGLGLAISHQFVKLMGGNMTVNSKKDKGSVFRFTIEVCPANTEEVNAAHTSSRRVLALAPGQPVYRILVADDKWDNRHLLAKLLGKLGFDVRESENGVQTLEVWESYAPHLIWMDMRMPIMDGYEATRRIKSTAKGQATAVIALTASAFEEDRKMVLSAGCDDFVRKPFRESEIFEMMEKHIGVQFVYEEDEKTCQESENRNTELNTEDIAALPKELSDALEDATVRADMNRIAEVINKIGQFDKNIGDVLRRMAEEFEYAEILKMFQNQEKTQSEIKGE